MTTPDLESLSTLTRDYAAFQARKSGLATALGGLMAAVLVLAALSPNAMGARMMDRLLYLIPTPWTIRGIEEARVYAVLVGQCILWLVPTFLFSFGTPARPMHSDWGLFGDFSGIGLIVLILTVQVWGALAMVRGWRGHREYQSLLRSLPRES